MVDCRRIAPCGTNVASRIYNVDKIIAEMVVTIFPSPGENWSYMQVIILALIPKGIFRLSAVALMGAMRHTVHRPGGLYGPDGYVWGENGAAAQSQS